MLGKLKAGQLDGAVVTAVSLSKVYKPIVALQMPGLFNSWGKLDAARDAMKGEFEKGVSDAGFTVLGWADVGLAHVMSRGFAVKLPEDLRSKKPYVGRDDIIQPILFQIVGGISPVPLNLPEVLPNLNSGAINVVVAPALAAEQFQWTSKVDFVMEDSAGAAIGAIIFSSDRLSKLPANLRTIVIETGRIVANALTKRIRDEDAVAFSRLQGKSTVVKLSVDERNKWNAAFKQSEAGSPRARSPQRSFRSSSLSPNRIRLSG